MKKVVIALMFIIANISLAFAAGTSDYLPLDVGNTWVYTPSYGEKGDRVDGIIGTEAIGGVHTYIWNRQEAADDNYNEKRWLAKDGTYLKVYKYFDNEGFEDAVVLSQSWAMLKLSPALGDTWTESVDVGSIHANIIYYVEAINDSIDVYAGSFQNCLRMRQVYEIIESGGTEYQYEKVWYAPGVGPVLYGKYSENWTNLSFRQELKTYSVAVSDGWENINGQVTYNGSPVCAMVLANGQHMFTCSGDGSFNLDVPLDEYGQIRVYAFCSGLAPFQQLIYPAEGQNMQIAMQEASPGQGMDVTTALQAINTTWVRLQGMMSYNGLPVCAMALANGQHMFTSPDDGHFSLDVPLDNAGSITQYGFCSGLPPYLTTHTSTQISFVDDTDDDGYTITQGDCNDLEADMHPWAVEICGDGIDQDCDGEDKTCPNYEILGSAGGTYTYGNNILTATFTYSTFSPDDGPYPGFVVHERILDVSETSMTWVHVEEGDLEIWHRAQGEAGDFVGTWTRTDDDEGVELVAEVTLKADMTFTYTEKWTP